MMPMGSKWRSALLNPAYAAASALIVIQVGLGIVYKIASLGGKTRASYAFSPSACITISESLKFLLSAAFFYREWRQRRESYQDGTASETEKFAPECSASDPGSEDTACDAEEFDASTKLHKSNGERMARLAVQGRMITKTFRRFVCVVMDEVPAEQKYGYIRLAMLYTFLNNTIYVCFKLADPGTIQLFKSGTTIVTAMVMYFSLGTKLVRLQWVAILLQLCGLVTTQYHPESGSNYAFSAYLLMISHTLVSGYAGVYNQNLNKSQDASLHVNNMVLYAAGAAINLVIHVVTKVVKGVDEPSFFVGYGSAAAIIVIISNVFIGLAMTAVYKYANAIIKCFATALATGLLLYISPLFSGTELSFLVLPGTLVVFISTWLYMEATPPKDTATERPFTKSERAIASCQLLGPNIAALIQASLTIVGVATLCISSSNLKDLGDIDTNELVRIGPYRNTTVTSPFFNTMAFIRLNNPEFINRLHFLESYRPFFYETHISIPNQRLDKDRPQKYNLTHDNHEDQHLIYVAVAKTLLNILDAPLASNLSKIEGLLFFDFDVWLDPLAFASNNFNNSWVPKVGDPPLLCMNDTSGYQWEWFRRGKDSGIKQAIRKLSALKLGYKLTNDREFCLGWSDIFYIPRRFFADWIILSEVFASESAFVEISVPTIFHIIERTRRESKWAKTTDKLADCWGDCCNDGATVVDVLRERCGHKLDYQKKDLVTAHFERLREEAMLLGRSVRVFQPGREWGAGMGNQTAEKNGKGEGTEAVEADGDSEKSAEVDRSKEDSEFQSHWQDKDGGEGKENKTTTIEVLEEANPEEAVNVVKENGITAVHVPSEDEEPNGDEKPGEVKGQLHSILNNIKHGTIDHQAIGEGLEEADVNDHGEDDDPFEDAPIDQIAQIDSLQ